MSTRPKNDRANGVTKFCLAMEEHRRTDAGRVRTAKEFVHHYFAHDERQATDALFLHMPNDVRGPLLSAWGIRGAKAALRDDADRVRTVVHDALIAGDIDETIFEEGVSPSVLVDWVPLVEWWSFWRNGKLTGIAVQRALATARELALIDDKWFLLNIQGRGGKLKGTDVLCDTLSKDQIVAWIRKLHESGDGSPAGLIAAIGWETVLTKTAQEALLFALDAFARKVGLSTEPEPKVGGDSRNNGGASLGSPSTTMAAVNPATTASAALGAANPEPATARHDRPPEVHQTIAAPDKIAAHAAEMATDKRDSVRPEAVAPPGLPVLIEPEDEDAEETSAGAKAPDPPSVVGERGGVWVAGVEESPKLAEARVAMMKTLQQSSHAAPPNEDAVWESEPPAKPSSLEWPDPSEADAGSKTPIPAAETPRAPQVDDIIRISVVSPPSEDMIPIDEDDVHSERAPGKPPPAPKRGIPRPS